MDSMEKKEEIQSEIIALKQLLTVSDYQALKYAEGQLSDEEYGPIRNERQSYRDKINVLEKELEELQ